MPNERAIFANTMFAGTEILWIEGKPHLVRVDNVRMSDCKGAHYVDVITGQKYHAKLADYDNPWCDLIGYSNISNPTISSVLDYMNGELLHNVTSGKFTDMDAINFIKSVEEKGPKSR